MSISLLHSKQMRSKKNLKNLAISGPLTLEQPGNVKIITSSLNPLYPTANDLNDDDDHVVILICKYDFIAENKDELTVKHNQYLKFIHKLGNGWILVHDLEDKSIKGLVPASYLDIAINDFINPITLSWLQEITNDNDNIYHHFNIESIFDDIIIDQVFQNLKDNIFWYKVEIKIDNQFIYIGKTYHEFYELHCKLLLINQYFDQLPKLPPPVFRTSYYHSQSTAKFNKNLIKKLYNLCFELQNYMKFLLKIPNILIQSIELYEFIYDCPQLIKNSKIISNDELIDKIYPNSIIDRKSVV